MPDNPYQRTEPTWWDRVKDNLGALEPSDISDFPAWAMGATRPSWEGRPITGSPWSPEKWEHSANWLKEQMDANPMAFAGSVLANPTTKALSYSRELFKDPFTRLPTGGTIRAMKGNQLLGEMEFTGSGGRLGGQNMMAYQKGQGVGTGLVDNFLDLATEHNLQPYLATPIASGARNFWSSILDKVKGGIPDFADDIATRLRQR